MQDKAVTREQIVVEARKWLGVRWRHQGRTKYGLDCVGLIIKVAHSLDIFDFDVTNYDRRAYAHMFLKTFKEKMIQKPIIQMLPGDVLIFRTHTEPHHTGIVTEKNGYPYIIHTSPMRTRTIEESLTFNAEFMVACFKYPGVIN